MANQNAILISSHVTQMKYQYETLSHVLSIACSPVEALTFWSYYHWFWHNAWLTFYCCISYHHNVLIAFIIFIIMLYVIMFYLLFLINILLLQFVDMWHFVLLFMIFYLFLTFYYRTLCNWLINIYHICINIVLAISSSMHHCMVDVIVLVHDLHRHSFSWCRIFCHHEVVLDCADAMFDDVLHPLLIVKCDYRIFMCSYFYLSFRHNTLLMIA